MGEKYKMIKWCDREFIIISGKYMRKEGLVECLIAPPG